MKVEVKKLNSLDRVIKITIEGEAFVKEKNDAYLAMGKKLKVSGFRPGTAPQDLLEKHHGDALREEFLKHSIPHYYQKALEDNQIVPAGLPRIYDVNFDGKSLSFAAELEVRPEVAIEENVYKGIKLKEKKAVVEEIDIEKAITSVKENIKESTGRELGDEDLARWAGYPDVAAFKDAVKTELYLGRLRDRRRNLDAQVGRHLLKEVKVEVPQGEFKRHHQQLVEREIEALRTRGIPEEDIEKYKKDIEEKIKPLAEEELKLFHIFEAIARKENIKGENNLGEVVLGLIMGSAQYGKE